MSRVQELERELARHNHLYHVEDNPEISDMEYDKLEREYYELTGVKYYTTHKTYDTSDKFIKVVHDFPVKSLNKISTDDELRKELLRLAPGIVELKYDGATVVDNAHKEVRTLATRGDGVTGEDITHSALPVVGMKSCLDLPVRMEAYLTFDNFERLNRRRAERGEQPYKNLRNAVAGMLRNLEPKDLDLISYTAYNILGSELSETEQLIQLKKAGYKIPPTEHVKYFTKNNIDEIIEWIHEFPTIRENLPFEIDGLVIKSDKPNAINYFGETEHHFKNAVAYKFESEGKWTTCTDVIWTVGRTGKVVPNARFIPVDLLNTSVDKASLHNASWLNKLQLSKGCEVFIVKCNDVIPGAVKTRNFNPDMAFSEPTVCPVCGKALERVESEEHEDIYQLYCFNMECPSKLITRIDNMAKKEVLDIVGLSTETATKMVDAGIVKQPKDVFKVSASQIRNLEGFADKSATKLYDAIQSRRTVPFARFLMAGGVPMVGKSTSEDIAKVFTDYEDLRADIISGGNKLESIPGIGARTVISIQKHYKLWEELSTVLSIESAKPIKKVNKQLTFVVTGTLPKKRKYYEDLIKNEGHKVSGSVSKMTSYLLAGEKAGSKLTKAQECGTPIITTEEELLEILGL